MIKSSEVQSLFLLCELANLMRVLKKFHICGWLCVLLMSQLYAQEQPTIPLIEQVEIQGYKPFSLYTLQGLLQTDANRKLLGRTPWRTVYQLGQNPKFPLWLKTVLEKSGEPPAHLNLITVEKDRSRLELYFQQKGLRNVSVKASIRAKDADSQYVSVRFDIVQGNPTYLRSFRYSGIENLSPDQQAQFLSKSVLYPANMPIQERQLMIRPKNQWYDETKLIEERRRVLNFFQQEGYAEITRDSVKVLVTPARPDSFDVVMRIRSGRRFRIGDVQFLIAGRDENVLPSAHELESVERLNQTFKVYAEMRNEGKLKPNLLREMMTFYPSEWYSQGNLDKTKTLLDQTGLFPFTNFSLQWKDVKQVNGEWIVPLAVDIRTRERYQTTLEGAVLQREDLSGQSEFGLGAAASYRNINVRGKGEQMQMRVAGLGSIESASPTTQFDASFAYSFPYPTFPFQVLTKRFSVPNYNVRTRLSLNFLAANRQTIKLKIRSRIALQYRLEMKHDAYRTSFVDAFDFSLSNPDTLSGFQTAFLNAINDINPNQRQRIIEDYTVQKINNAFRYVVRASNTDLLRRDKGYVREYGAEIGGNLPYLWDRFIQTPQTVEGSVTWFNREGRLVYRPYTRVYADLRRYVQVNQSSMMAVKLFVGWAESLGRMPDLSPEDAAKFQFTVPFERRFFIGGSSSLRAWNLGELGPGLNGQAGFLGGDIKIESSVERRVILWRELFAADWSSAFFLDAGNIWNGRRNNSAPQGKFRFDSFGKEIAVGAGTGIRIAWPYFILRLDFGVKLYQPTNNGNGMFPNGIRPNFVLGLGQAF